MRGEEADGADVCDVHVDGGARASVADGLGGPVVEDGVGEPEVVLVGLGCWEEGEGDEGLTIDRCRLRNSRI